MKILVGIMHCIENEFEQCLAAIDQQTHPAYDRFIISNLPNKEAHDRLYETFMKHANKVDLFVKVDADMVLSRKTFFEELVARFIREEHLKHLQIALDDWFTDRRIMGLHAYRNDYRWVRNDELHFVDTVANGIKTVKTVNDRSILAPAAIHCPNPSPFQAFHFGVHKAVKVLQRGRNERHLGFSCTHWGHFACLESHYYRKKDFRLGLAVAGFLHAIQNLYEPSHVDFACTETKMAFEHYQNLQESKLNRELRSLGLYAWSALPHALRYELAYYHSAEDKRLLDWLRVLNRWRLNRFNRFRLDEKAHT